MALLPLASVTMASPESLIADVHVVDAEAAVELERRLADEGVLVRELGDLEAGIQLDLAAGGEDVVAPGEIGVDDALARAGVVEVEEAQVMIRRDAPQQVAADPRLVAGVAEGLVEVDLGLVGRLAVEARLEVGADDEAAEVADEGAVEKGLGRPAGLGTGVVREAGGEQRTHGQLNERNCPHCLHRVAPPCVFEFSPYRRFCCLPKAIAEDGRTNLPLRARERADEAPSGAITTLPSTLRKTLAVEGRCGSSSDFRTSRPCG